VVSVGTTTTPDPLLNKEGNQGGGKMNRRAFLGDSSRAALGLGLASRLRLGTAYEEQDSAGATASQTTSDSVLPRTTPLTLQGDLAAQMVDGIRQFLLRQIQTTAQERGRLWQRNYQSLEEYNRSVSPNRERFRRIIGAVDPRVGVQAPELLATMVTSAQVSQRSGYKVYAVSWPVFGQVVADFDGLDAEGLLLQPEGKPVARVVAIPDADWTPEMLVGLAPGVPPEAQFAQRLAESGCQVASRTGESHPRALPEPYANLSAHTAPSVQPLSIQKRPVSKQIR
jgi:hypothetical protein